MLVFTGRTGQAQDVNTILAAKLTRTQEFEDKFQKYTWGIISRFIRKKRPVLHMKNLLRTWKQDFSPKFCKSSYGGRGKSLPMIFESMCMRLIIE